MCLVVESILLIIATSAMVTLNIDLRALFVLKSKMLVSILVWGLGGGLLVTLSNIAFIKVPKHLSEQFFPLKSMHDLFESEIVPLFGELSFSDSLLIALASGICEEIFFRGILQSYTNVLTCNFCFAMCHFPSFYYYPYALWAGAVGFLMSFLTLHTGSIYPAILAHAVINLASLSMARSKAREHKE